MSLQFSTCLGSATGAFVATTVRNALVGAMQALDSNHDDPPPDPEVRHSCVNGKSTWGGWLRPVGGYGATDTATARNVGLSQVSTLAAGESFAFNFKPVGITRLVQIRWNDQPRRLDDDGNADPGGDVHLTGFGLSYQNADYYGRRIVDLTITGWYDGIQNTDIAIDIDDFLTVSQYGQLNCETYAWVHPTETTIDTILASLTGGAGGSLGDVLGQGPGCQIANRLPRTVLVPQSAIKAVFTYTRVNSFPSTGLTAGGTWALVNRQPWVDVQGPFSLLAEPGERVRRSVHRISPRPARSLHDLVVVAERDARVEHEPSHDRVEPPEPGAGIADPAHPLGDGHRRRRQLRDRLPERHPEARRRQRSDLPALQGKALARPVPVMETPA